MPVYLGKELLTPYAMVPFYDHKSKTYQRCLAVRLSKLGLDNSHIRLKIFKALYNFLGGKSESDPYCFIPDINQISKFNYANATTLTFKDPLRYVISGNFFCPIQYTQVLRKTPKFPYVHYSLESCNIYDDKKLQEFIEEKDFEFIQNYAFQFPKVYEYFTLIVKSLENRHHRFLKENNTFSHIYQSYLLKQHLCISKENQSLAFFILINNEHHIESNIGPIKNKTYTEIVHFLTYDYGKESRTVFQDISELIKLPRIEIEALAIYLANLEEILETPKVLILNHNQNYKVENGQVVSSGFKPTFEIITVADFENRYARLY